MSLSDDLFSVPDQDVLLVDERPPQDAIKLPGRIPGFKGSKSGEKIMLCFIMFNETEPSSWHSPWSSASSSSEMFIISENSDRILGGE